MGQKCGHVFLYTSRTDLLIFDTAPQPFDEDVIEKASSAIHADSDVGVLQQPVKARDVNCAPWVGIEDLRGTHLQRLIAMLTYRNGRPACWAAATIPCSEKTSQGGEGKMALNQRSDSQ